jgi:hypothetical protein
MRYLLLTLLVFAAFMVSAQLPFDDCDNAKIISDPKSYCSGKSEFSLQGMTDSGYGPASCWTGKANDIWFEFTALATGVNIVVNGDNIGSTLRKPQAALYQGVCGGQIDELDCERDNSSGGLSLTENGLVIGGRYLIRVAGENNTVGNFQICVNNFNPPVLPGQDCPTGAILCDKSSFVVQSLSGTGSITNEGAGTCLQPGGTGNSEDQSIWFRWIAGTNGTLTFDITPLRDGDDIDFALFELPSGVDDCKNKKAIRCNATACDGTTGLNNSSTDLNEDFNCDPGEDRYVKFIDMVAGKAYGLLINNFENSGIGFKMDFGGTGEFQGPKPDFDITPLSGLRCDQDFTVTDISTNPSGLISEYEWNFGSKAIPKTSSDKGPHNVNYESFGKKFISLTVSADNGCKVTKIKELYAEPCCDDLIDINILSEVKFLDCFGVPSGKILVKGQGGSPEYFFKFQDGKFSPKSSFENLKPGNYEIAIQDLKGCTDSINVTILEPELIIVDAGPDQVIDLGDKTSISGSYAPIGSKDSIFWTPVKGIETPNNLSSEVLPPGTTTYVLNVLSKDGCLAKDSLTIRVNSNYVIYSPNVIFTESLIGNNIFNIVGRKSTKNIDLLEIFDRWGNKVYNGVNISPFDKAQGWDGTFNGAKVQQGVYTWLAHVRYVDETVQIKSGDVTVIREK